MSWNPHMDWNVNEVNFENHISPGWIHRATSEFSLQNNLQLVQWLTKKIYKFFNLYFQALCNNGLKPPPVTDHNNMTKCLPLMYCATHGWMLVTWWSDFSSLLCRNLGWGVPWKYKASGIVGCIKQVGMQHLWEIVLIGVNGIRCKHGGEPFMAAGN